MPTTTKRNNARDSRIRRSKLDQSPVEDARDLDLANRPAASPAPVQKTALDITQSPQHAQALALPAQARKLVVTDQASHARALEFVGGAKSLKRAVGEHYTKIKRAIDAVKNVVLTMEKSDTAPIDEAIAIASKPVIEYENAEKARIAREDQERREKLEREAQEQRERDLAEQERQASELEAKSEELSARERYFVDEAYRQGLYHASTVLAGADRKLVAICKAAGYQFPDKSAARLVGTPKILAALNAKQQAAIIREQAQAVKEQPLELAVDLTPVTSNLARVSGVTTRTTYACDPAVDVDALRQAFLEGKVPAAALVPDMVYLNLQARALKEQFEASFPGCALKKTQSIAG